MKSPPSCMRPPSSPLPVAGCQVPGAGCHACIFVQACRPSNTHPLTGVGCHACIFVQACRPSNTQTLAGAAIRYSTVYMPAKGRRHGTQPGESCRVPCLRRRANTGIYTKFADDSLTGAAVTIVQGSFPKNGPCAFSQPWVGHPSHCRRRQDSSPFRRFPSRNGPTLPPKLLDFAARLRKLTPVSCAPARRLFVSLAGTIFCSQHWGIV